MNGQASADQLRAARVAVDGLLGFFGGEGEDARADTVMASGHIAVRIGSSSVEAEALHGMLKSIVLYAEEHADDPARARAANAVVVLAVTGLFTSRATCEMMLASMVRDTVAH